MRGSLRGRAVGPLVGVAYDTNVDEARRILLSIAEAHPQVIGGDESTAAPSVLVMGFGDSALNLELRFFVRDVNQRLTVLSDVNFAVLAAFRTADIEIPFPQRDLHWRGEAPPVPDTVPAM